MNEVRCNADPLDTLLDFLETGNIGGRGSKGGDNKNK